MLARPRVPAYLKRIGQGGRMVLPLSAPGNRMPPPRSGVAAAIVIAATASGAALIAAAAALWFHYGTTVFFEMIKSGIAACI